MTRAKLMTNTQAACYALIASALVLSGMLALRVGDYTQQADASLVINKDSFTLLTAMTSNQEESLFVLNNETGQLVVYKVSLGGRGNNVELVATQNLGRLFDGLRQNRRRR